jgi:predicted NBD/HSP70 family sugar kinase
MEMLQEKATRQYTKEHNIRLITQVIYDELRFSRADVARKTKLTRATVTEIVKELISNGLVREVGEGQSSGGRIPTLLSIEKDARHIIAVDVSPDQLTGALINLRGEIKEYTTSALDKQNEEVIQEQIFDFINQLKRASKETRVLGIGLSITGVVNTDTGVLLFANRLNNLRNVRFKDILRGQHDGLPVCVMNNGHALALGEYSLIQGEPPVTNLIAIRTGSGIGGGLILNGKVFDGDGYGAGEFGKDVVEYTCGKYGKLAAVATDEAIRDRYEKLASQVPTTNRRRKGQSRLTLEQISKAAQDRDSVARHIIEETGRYFGRAIGYLVNALSVHHIIVSGDIHVFGDRLRDEMTKEMEIFSDKELATNTIIKIVPVDNKKYLIGAASQVLMHTLGIMPSSTSLNSTSRGTA